MTDLEQRPKRKYLLATLVTLLIGFGVGFGAGYVASEFVGFLSGLAPEYNSAAVIREITSFVEKNKTWPTSWSAIGMEPQSRVNVNWSLDLNTCDRHEIMISVAPETGGFYTYPYAKQDLEHLWRLVVKIQDERADETVNGRRQ